MWFWTSRAPGPAAPSALTLSVWQRGKINHIYSDGGKKNRSHTSAPSIEPIRTAHLRGPRSTRGCLRAAQTFPSLCWAGSAGLWIMDAHKQAAGTQKSCKPVNGLRAQRLLAKGASARAKELACVHGGGVGNRRRLDPPVNVDKFTQCLECNVCNFPLICQIPGCVIAHFSVLSG